MHGFPAAKEKLCAGRASQRNEAAHIKATEKQRGKESARKEECDRPLSTRLILLTARSATVFVIDDTAPMTQSPSKSPALYA